MAVYVLTHIDDMKMGKESVPNLSAVNYVHKVLHGIQCFRRFISYHIKEKGLVMRSREISPKQHHGTARNPRMLVLMDIIDPYGRSIMHTHSIYSPNNI